MVSCWIMATKYSWKWVSEVVKSVLCMSVCCASILTRSHWSFRLRGKILEVKIFYVLCWVFPVWRWGTGILNKAEMSWHSVGTFLWMFLMRWQGWTTAVLILMLSLGLTEEPGDALGNIFVFSLISQKTQFDIVQTVRVHLSSNSQDGALISTSQK